MQHRFLRTSEDVSLGTGIGWRDRSYSPMCLRMLAKTILFCSIARLLRVGVCLGSSNHIGIVLKRTGNGGIRIL